ncbi:MAG: hypothetical protein HQK53_15160, partial [Oligoflexia bacterium]|nr:hypothetical protein [Oligoflexia bacterium]
MFSLSVAITNDPTYKIGELTVITLSDNLWRISKRLFGSGFYYAKVWSLNAYITNPHEIKPEMVLVFDTGDATTMPQLQVGSFDSDSDAEETTTADASTGNGSKEKKTSSLDFANFGDESEPPWIKERADLKKKGLHIEFATENTYNDINRLGRDILNQEYDKYEPPRQNAAALSNDQYDSSGLSKDSKITFNFREGFSYTTFVTSNLIQDFGEIDSSSVNGQFL